MGGKGESDGGRRITYCVVPRDLAGKLHEPLRRHFREDPRVEVIVERRARDRRSGVERRSAEKAARERRTIRNPGGRRVGDRRAALAEVAPPALPRRARPHADRLRFVERLEPGTEHAEDLDTARLVTRVQAGDREVFTEIYMRYFDRVYSYLRVVFRDEHQAEDTTQHVFAKAFEAIPRYERRRQPFSAWLFVIVRNLAISELERRRRTEVVDPRELALQRERAAPEDTPLDMLNWISDRELLLFVERLPLAQRQVLVLRYMLDLPGAEVARLLERSPEDVRILQHRALRFLRDRLAAVGRTSSRPGGRIRMRTPRRHSRVLRNRRFSLSP